MGATTAKDAYNNQKKTALLAVFLHAKQKVQSFLLSWVNGVN